MTFSFWNWLSTFERRSLSFRWCHWWHLVYFFFCKYKFASIWCSWSDDVNFKVLYLLNFVVNIFVLFDKWQLTTINQLLINKWLSLPKTSNLLDLCSSTPFITSSKITSWSSSPIALFTGIAWHVSSDEQLAFSGNAYANDIY